MSDENKPDDQTPAPTPDKPAARRTRAKGKPVDVTGRHIFPAGWEARR